MLRVLQILDLNFILSLFSPFIQSIIKSQMQVEISMHSFFNILEIMTVILNFCWVRIFS